MQSGGVLSEYLGHDDSGPNARYGETGRAESSYTGFIAYDFISSERRASSNSRTLRIPRE